MTADLDGRVAIVTGAARGIGAATARELVSIGASVVLVDKRDDLGSALADELGPAAIYESADVTSPEDWDRVMARAVEEFGGLDVLVNNAGIIRVAPLIETDLESFRKVIDTNLVSTFLGTKAAIPLLTARGGGSIVNLASPQGIEGRDGMSAYTASKFGVRGFTRTAAIELGQFGIRVNCVVPGPTRTAMTERKGWSDADYDEAYGGYPLGRMGRPEEVASMIAFLASDASSFCTGSDFIVDGGVLAGKPKG